MFVRYVIPCRAKYHQPTALDKLALALISQVGSDTLDQLLLLQHADSSGTHAQKQPRRNQPQAAGKQSGQQQQEEQPWLLGEWLQVPVHAEQRVEHAAGHMAGVAKRATELWSQLTFQVGRQALSGWAGPQRPYMTLALTLMISSVCTCLLLS